MSSTFVRAQKTFFAILQAAINNHLSPWYTTNSVYRAKKIFGADKILIFTQEYHLYRAMYIAQQFDMEAYGVASDLDTYSGQFKRDVREMLARCKDFGMCILKPKPTYLGDAIPISGSGDATNDE